MNQFSNTGPVADPVVIRLQELRGDSNRFSAMVRRYHKNIEDAIKRGVSLTEILAALNESAPGKKGTMTALKSALSRIRSVERGNEAAMMLGEGMFPLAQTVSMPMMGMPMGVGQQVFSNGIGGGVPPGTGFTGFPQPTMTGYQMGTPFDGANQ